MVNDNPATRAELSQYLQEVWGFKNDQLWNFSQATLAAMVADLKESTADDAE